MICNKVYCLMTVYWYWMIVITVPWTWPGRSRTFQQALLWSPHLPTSPYSFLLLSCSGSCWLQSWKTITDSHSSASARNSRKSYSRDRTLLLIFPLYAWTPFYLWGKATVLPWSQVATSWRHSLNILTRIYHFWGESPGTGAPARRSSCGRWLCLTGRIGRAE